MLRIAICDDEETTAQILLIRVRKFMKARAFQFETDVFCRSTELLESCRQNYYDLILLDIDMPELTGFDISEHLRKNNIPTEIIFISGRENFVFQSIKHRPFRFIRKSCLDSELDESLNGFLECYQKKNTLFSFRCEDFNITVPLRQIKYFESYNHDIILNMENGDTYSLNRKYNLKTLECQLEEHGFIRIHKSYLVNFRHISLIRETNIILTDGTVLPSAKQRIATVKSIYRNLIMEDL